MDLPASKLDLVPHALKKWLSFLSEEEREKYTSLALCHVTELPTFERRIYVKVQGNVVEDEIRYKWDDKQMVFVCKNITYDDDISVTINDFKAFDLECLNEIDEFEEQEILGALLLEMILRLEYD